MTDETTNAGAQQPAPDIKLLAHFTRDLSFENVGAMEGISAEGNPEIAVNVGFDAKRVNDDNRYQLAMKINGTAKVGDATRFMVELDYAGVFQINNVPEQHIHPFLFIECPRLLLPFARRVVADVTRDGGYPPLMLDNVDFAALYRQRLEQLQAQQGGGEQTA